VDFGELRVQFAGIFCFVEACMRVRILCLLSILLIISAGCAPATKTPEPPAETPTPAPVALINLLQEHLNGMDPVGAVLDANFTILDVTYEKDPSEKERTVYISINCNDQGDTCGPERSFAVVIMALKAKKKKLAEIMPPTLKELQVYPYDHLTGTGIVKANWQDVKDYYNDVITGPQLAKRVTINQ
jgi:hypothetical protein